MCRLKIFNENIVFNFQTKYAIFVDGKNVYYDIGLIMNAILVKCIRNLIKISKNV